MLNPDLFPESYISQSYSCFQNTPPFSSLVFEFFYPAIFDSQFPNGNQKPKVSRIGVWDQHLGAIEVRKMGRRRKWLCKNYAKWMCKFKICRRRINLCVRRITASANRWWLQMVVPKYMVCNWPKTWLEVAWLFLSAISQAWNTL